MRGLTTTSTRSGFVQDWIQTLHRLACYTSVSTGYCSGAATDTNSTQGRKSRLSGHWNTGYGRLGIGWWSRFTEHDSNRRQLLQQIPIRGPLIGWVMLTPSDVAKFRVGALSVAVFAVEATHSAPST